MAAHLVTIKFCVDLRAEMLLFANGESLFDNLPRLCRAVAQLTPLSVSERKVERKHRMISMGLSRAPAAGIAALSLTERLPELQNALSEEPSIMQILAEHCDVVYNPLSAARYLGFGRHPALSKVFTASGEKSEGWEGGKLVKEVVYHLDTYTQHLDLESAVPRQIAVGPRRPARVGMAEVAPLLDQLLQRTAVALFSERSKTGQFFSLPKSSHCSLSNFFAVLAGSSQLPPQRMQPLEGGQVASAISEPLDECCDDGVLAMPAQAAPPRDPVSKHVFFRLVQKGIGLKKLSRSDDPLRFDLSQFVVVEHDVLHASHADQSVSVALHPSGGREGLMLLKSENIQDVVLWSGTCSQLEMVWDVGDLPAESEIDARELCSLLASAGAFPHTACFLHLTEGDANRLGHVVSAMCEVGLVDRRTSGLDCHELQFSKSALGRLGLGIKLARPVRPCVVDVTAWQQSWTTYECLRCLKENNFQCASAGRCFHAWFQRSISKVCRNTAWPLQHDRGRLRLHLRASHAWASLFAIPLSMFEAGGLRRQIINAPSSNNVCMS